MAILDSLKPRAAINQDNDCRFDYPEVFVVLLAISLILLHFEFNAPTTALFIIVCLPSLMILIYNYRRKPSIWTTNIVVVLISTVIGAMQFYPVLSLSLALLMGIRIILSAPETRLRLIMVSVITMVMFFYVSVTLNGASLDYHNAHFSVLILLATICAVLWQYWDLHHNYISRDATAELASGRIDTLVSVINKLTRFVPKQIWQPIVKSDSPVDVFNKRAKLSIMFSDIAGFTELSDSLSADNLADILNTYMQCMTNIANKHGAVLDKFIGDGMVCFFGEPNSRGVRQDALDCVAMAVDMRREMRSLRQKWRLMGFEGLYVRIGITTGYCHVGNFGSNNRLSYTLIGKEANLASRLEAAASKSEILISQTTYDYICHDYDCEYAGHYQLKGFDDTISAWQVLDPDDTKGSLSKWIDHTLPGFNLHLNFKDIKNYDYQDIKSRLNVALERMEREEQDNAAIEK